jgi:hypothetical protein
MATIKESAQNAKLLEFGNVSNLEKLNIDTPLVTKEFQRTDGTTFQITGFEMDRVFYRVPQSVILDIKALLKEIPDLQFVKVTKSGSGKQTRYIVRPA